MTIRNINQEGYAKPFILVTIGMFAAGVTAGIVFSSLKKNTLKTEVNIVFNLINDTRPLTTSSAYSEINNKIIADAQLISQDLILDPEHFKSNIADGLKVSTVYNNQDKMITHLKLEFINISPDYCFPFISSFESKTDLISLNTSIQKNLFESSYPVQYLPAKTEDACNEISETNKKSLVLAIPYKIS